MTEWLFPLAALVVLALTIPISWWLKRWDTHLTNRDRAKYPTADTSDVNALVHDCVRTVSLLRSALHGESGAYTVNMHLSPVPPVAVDATKLRGALNNVLQNTVEIMPSGGTIDIATGYDAERVFVIVGGTDTPGRGSFLAEPVGEYEGDKRGGQAFRDAYEIVSRHGGEFEFKSAPGFGRRVLMRLPAYGDKRPSLKPSMP